MRMGWLRAAALLLSVLLGVTGGLTAAALVRDSDRPTEPRTADSDPLGVGTDLVDQDCTGRSIMLVGRGATAPILSAALAENPGARYLATANSCDTLWASVDNPVPEYVAYLGPYDTAAEACGLRMTEEHKGDNVTRLKEGNDIFVKCPCHLATGDWPVLTPGAEAGALEGMWIRQLQFMLEDLGRLTEEQGTGVYDPATVAAVKKIQASRLPTPNGVVDQQTWLLIRERACRSYDY